MTQHFWFNLFVFLNVALLIILAMNISRIRIKEKIANGDGGNVIMKKAIRAHGNGVEHVMVAGLTVLALEFGQAPAAFMATVVLGFSVSRILHAYGMLAPNFNSRRAGAAGSYFFEIFGIAGVLIYGIIA